ncbi:Type II secretion system protein G precursor [Planctomycetes bacterium Pan216]|uniref:Type II secretion system protein G n=1 Tax=Kolteria novifilia TaxID=2527975 RepID=A0A518BAV2_9BACT|nr:Type II secretion system protein G precursor [Planctomycetes bacterium Pan216]
MAAPSSFARPRRCAFTLIELLVVLAIIGFLLSLLMPAVMGARASAQRLQCTSRLHSIGVAITGFTDSHGEFPRTFCGATRENGRSRGYCFSGFVELLPWLDRHDVADKVNWKDETTDRGGQPPLIGDNASAMSAQIASLLCPSDTAPRMGASYRFCRGVLPNWPTDPGGAFCIYSKKPRDITKGLSQTAFVSERSRATALGFTDGSSLDFVTPCVAANQSGPAFLDEDCGATWFRGAHRHVTYVHYLPPNAVMKDCVASNQAFMSARSWHQGGVHVLYGDGHVAFVDNAIDLILWRRLATREEAFDQLGHGL